MIQFKNSKYILREWKITSFVGNKAKGRISKQVFQENKARQIFRKTNISNPLIRPFALLPTHWRIQVLPFHQEIILSLLVLFFS